MTEKAATAQQRVRLAARHALKALQQSTVDVLGAELFDQLLIVDGHLLPIHVATLDVPGSDFLGNVVDFLGSLVFSGACARVVDAKRRLVQRRRQ